MRPFIPLSVLVALLATACADSTPTGVDDNLSISNVPDDCPNCVFGPYRFSRRRNVKIMTVFGANGGECVLSIEDDGTESTSIAAWINGTEVVRHRDLLGPVSKLDVPVTLHPTQDTLVTSVRGEKEHFVTLWITCGETINVSPDPVTMGVGETQQFTVTGYAGPYTWHVNGVVGGNNELGTIDASGLYVAPANVPVPSPLPVCARVTASPGISDCAWVTIVPPPPPLSLSPATVALPAQRSLQFTVSGAPGPYLYSVNGVDNGNATVGAIDGNGLYLAPDEAPVPAQVEVCVRLAGDATQYDCSSVTITLEGIVVFNDLMIFNRWSMVAENPDNGLLFRNLVSFSSSKPRGMATGAIIDLGHGSYCQGGDFSPCEPFDSLAVIAASAGITLVAQDTTDLEALPANIKVLVLWVPTQYYTTQEINAMKRFVVEGGRLVFVGAGEPAYTLWGGGMALENDFLARMGATMRDAGGNSDCRCAYPVQSHQVTSGMAQVLSHWSAVVQVGPYDVPLYSDWSGHVLAAVAQIDPTPILE